MPAGICPNKLRPRRGEGFSTHAKNKKGPVRAIGAFFFLPSFFFRWKRVCEERAGARSSCLFGGTGLGRACRLMGFAARSWELNRCLAIEVDTRRCLRRFFQEVTAGNVLRVFIAAPFFLSWHISQRFFGMILKILPCLRGTGCRGFLSIDTAQFFDDPRLQSLVEQTSRASDLEECWEFQLLVFQWSRSQFDDDDEAVGRSAVDYPTFPVNQRHSHLFAILAGC